MSALAAEQFHLGESVGGNSISPINRGYMQLLVGQELRGAPQLDREIPGSPSEPSHSAEATWREVRNTARFG